jgi:TatD DNase family protein
MDTHAHLEEVLDLEREVERAKKMGVAAIITMGANLDANRKALQISRKFGGYVFPAIGIHPWEVGRSLKREIEFIGGKVGQCVAIGEVGLDFWISTNVKLQRKAFEVMLEIASDAGKPICVHSRGAWRECFDLVRKHDVRKVVFHWYSGPTDVLKGILDAGYYVSATPAVEYSKKHIEAVKATPIERLLLETDAPVVYKGRVSTPSDVMKTLKAVAKVKTLSESEVARVTTRSAVRFFDLKLR